MTIHYDRKTILATERNYFINIFYISYVIRDVSRVFNSDILYRKYYPIKRAVKYKGKWFLNNTRIQYMISKDIDRFKKYYVNIFNISYSVMIFSNELKQIWSRPTFTIKDIINYPGLLQLVLNRGIIYEF